MLTVRCEAQAGQPAQTTIIHLAEIDAPEKRQPFGNRSRQALGAAALLGPGVRHRLNAKLECGSGRLQRLATGW